MISVETMGWSLNCRIPRSRSDSDACPHRGVDIGHADLFAQLDEQVHHRAIGHRHPGRHTVQLALQLR